jgi:DNA-binding MarR family transcriptional regulator
MPMPDAPLSLSTACACGRLRRAARALTQLYDDAMAPAGLRVTQFSLLRALARNGPMRITELAAAQLLDRTALSRNLDPLLGRGLVKATRGSDARTREVALTHAGEAALRAAMPRWRRAQAQVAKRLGGAKLETLIETLGDIEALHPDTAQQR